MRWNPHLPVWFSAKGAAHEDTDSAMPKAAALTLALEDFDAAVFDLDGVVTKTAAVHAAAWKELFDTYLRAHAARAGEPFRPFDIQQDYLRYVDGKPRYDGVQSFLASRDISLPYGTPDDSPDKETICGLGNRKNRLFNDRLARTGVEAYETSVGLIRDLRRNRIRTAVVSSSRNAKAVLKSAGLKDLFDACVDGIEAARLSLRGKPDPDIYLHAIHLLGARPERAVGVEDALSGVEALRAAGYALVIGVDRSDQAEALRDHGANVVVRDLGELQLAQRL